MRGALLHFPLHFCCCQQVIGKSLLVVVTDLLFVQPGRGKKQKAPPVSTCAWREPVRPLPPPEQRTSLEQEEEEEKAPTSMDRDGGAPLLSLTPPRKKTLFPLAGNLRLWKDGCWPRVRPSFFGLLLRELTSGPTRPILPFFPRSFLLAPCPLCTSVQCGMLRLSSICIHPMATGIIKMSRSVFYRFETPLPNSAILSCL